jgi:hypothetical protein
MRPGGLPRLAALLLLGVAANYEPSEACVAEEDEVCLLQQRLFLARLRNGTEDEEVFTRSISHVQRGHQIAEVSAEVSGEWILVSRQTVGFYDWPKGVWSLNADNPDADNYAILDRLEEFRGADGKFEFKLKWSGASAEKHNEGPQIWKQSSNPTTSTTVSGYEEIDCPCHDRNWFGLALSQGGLGARIDGSEGQWFFYCIMCLKSIGTGEMEGLPSCKWAARKTELYVWKEKNLNGCKTAA